MTILNYSSGPVVVSLSHLAAAFSSNVVCRVVLGTKFEGDEIGVKFWEIVNEFMYLMGVFNVDNFVPWLAWLNHLNGVNARIEKNLDRIFESVIQYHIQRGGSGGVKDFVDVALITTPTPQTRRSHQTLDAPDSHQTLDTPVALTETHCDATTTEITSTPQTPQPPSPSPMQRSPSKLHNHLRQA